MSPSPLREWGLWGALPTLPTPKLPNLLAPTPGAFLSYLSCLCCPNTVLSASAQDHSNSLLLCFSISILRRNFSLMHWQAAARSCWLLRADCSICRDFARSWHQVGDLGLAVQSVYPATEGASGFPERVLLNIYRHIPVLAFILLLLPAGSLPLLPPLPLLKQDFARAVPGLSSSHLFTPRTHSI